MNIVHPKHARGLNMDPLYLFTLGLVHRGPRWTITCGQCALQYEARLPLVDGAPTTCPHCQSVNVLDVMFR